jgi:L-seryl-tRNA(Ser) seleniumtransferase
VRVTWDPSTPRRSASAIVRALQDGEPSIAIRAEGDALVVGVWMMQPGEEKVVGRRLRQELERRA